MLDHTNNTYQISDSNYKDVIRAHPAHYYSMRAKPTNPVAIIEQNIKSLRTYPHINSFMRSTDEWRFFKKEKQSKKRCLFSYDQNNMQIHLASIDTISNQHLQEPVHKLPYDDDVFRKIGQKRNKIDKRNGISMNNHGDKTYKAVEYSKEFFSKANRNWRTEYFGLTKRSEEPLPDELMELLSSNQRKTFSSIFSNRFDYGYEHDPRIEREEDVNVVKSLDLWRTSSPLAKPFKVLDVSDRNIKYRPKVTR